MYKIISIIIIVGFWVTLPAQDKVLINSDYAINVSNTSVETEAPLEYDYAPVQTMISDVKIKWITVGCLTAAGVVTLCAALLGGKTEKQDKTTQVVVVW